MRHLPVFLGGFALCVASNALAESRYQAVPINAGSDFGTEKALILDTMEGHLWIWTASPATDTEAGGRYIIYQGQLFPGKEIGEVVLKQEWSPPAAPDSTAPP
ncbi:MAG: hypothetical protein FJ164_12760 [Gammaproteobacteria bacterium]|nr:hypothetical protein [Gammaproteobacteria bacterium]